MFVKSENKILVLNYNRLYTNVLVNYRSFTLTSYFVTENPEDGLVDGGNLGHVNIGSQLYAVDSVDPPQLANLVTNCFCTLLYRTHKSDNVFTLG